jgi:hypothetical protein
MSAAGAMAAMALGTVARVVWLREEREREMMTWKKGAAKKEKERVQFLNPHTFVC